MSALLSKADIPPPRELKRKPIDGAEFNPPPCPFPLSGTSRNIEIQELVVISKSDDLLLRGLT
jgi:hypothetical protein